MTTSPAQRSQPSLIGKAAMLLLASALTSTADQRQAADGIDTLSVTKYVAPSNGLKEEAPVGPNEQPGWTMARRFPSTRVYIQKAPWEVGFEQWWRGRFFKNGSAGHLFQEELSVGLPGRLQADVYENWVMDDKRHARHHDTAVEMRWALAEWGKIPLNPTIYGEWKFVDKTQGPDVFELKLLLGEELAPRWHWGLNGIYEQETGGGRATEWAWSQGVSYTLIDQRMSAGLEMKFSHETAIGSRSQPEIKYLLGPSVQWHLSRTLFLDVVPLFGVTHDAPKVEAFAVLSWDFWPGKREASHYTPSSLKGQ